MFWFSGWRIPLKRLPKILYAHGIVIISSRITIVSKRATYMVTESDVNELVDKVEKVTKRRELDLSSDADLSIGIMNLINLEEHLFFTAEETGKDEYFDLLQEVRKMRVELLKKIIKEYEGEVWCISKHLLTAAMRLMETGTKQLDAGNREEAKSLFAKSYRLIYCSGR